MDDSLMQALVDRHMRAEGHGDIDGALAVYTDNIEHDVVGFPNSPTRGKEGARDFYTYLPRTSAPKAGKSCIGTSMAVPRSHVQ
jgi:hypothetical protein